MVSLSAGTLTVRYLKLRDRLSHTIGVVCGDVYLPLLESVEGTEQESWPASPPMQQMVEESFTPESSPVLLGVGLSGNGHWSTAIESQKDQRLKFDIACKNSKAASVFGSEYGILTEGVSQIDDHTISLPFVSASGTSRMEIVVTIGTIQLRAQEKRIRIFPNSDPGSVLTHRWCYEVSVDSPSV